MLRDVAHHYARKLAKDGNDITYGALPGPVARFYLNDGPLKALPGANARGLGKVLQRRRQERAALVLLGGRSDRRSPLFVQIQP
jgi:hypothetical protein